MNRQSISTLVRACMTTIGFFFIGKYFLGNRVDLDMIEMINGIVLSAISIYWGMADKTVSIEAWQSFLRQAIVGIGGLLIAKGYTSMENVNNFLGVILSIIPVFYSILSRKKSENITTGNVSVEDLKQ